MVVVGGYVIKSPILQLAIGGMVAYLPLFICLFSNKTGVLPARIALGRSEMEMPHSSPLNDSSDDKS